MTKIPLYCSADFLSALYKHIDKPMADWLEDTDSDYIKQLYKLIHQKGEIIIDTDIKEFISEQSPKYNPNFKRLLKNGRTPPFHDKLSFDKITSQSQEFFATEFPTHAIIFNSASPETAKDIEDKFGVINFSINELTKTGFLFQNGLELFLRGEQNEWDFITKYKHPFNALAISDQYILSTPESRNNLKSLLQNILPKSLSIPFHLTIITNRNNAALPKVEQVYEEINQFLTGNFDYVVKLTIVIAKIHDRNFITNYLWCSSGYGFELINNGQTCRNTHLAILPITYTSQGNKAYKQENTIMNEGNETICMINALKNEYQNAVMNTPIQLGLLTNVIGNRENRLFN